MISPALSIILWSFLACALVLTSVWAWQLKTKNAGVVDIWWSYCFGLVVIICSIFGNGWTNRELLISAMVVIWSGRLGTYLLIRNVGKDKKEDTRYAQLREEYGTQVNFKMWRFFMYQAVSIILLSTPFIIICLNPENDWHNLEFIGAGLWILGIAGESIADNQLKNFKKDPTNKGKICQVGLWKYSRHPNYFFEWVIWVSYAVFALASPLGYIAIICPIIMYFLLNKVTGIPMLEELAVKSKGEAYINYQKTTSAFFPWFRKRT